MKHKPKAVDLTAWNQASDYQKNRDLFEWLSDDERRLELYRELEGRSPFVFPSRAIRRNSELEPRVDPGEHDPDYGHKNVYLLTRREHIEDALTDTKLFSNSPYRKLGGGSFVLALDDAKLRDRQLRVLREVLPMDRPLIGLLSEFARDSAALLSLRAPAFDLAEFSQQAAIRFCSALFGFAIRDYPLLETALLGAYGALTYQNFARHFVTDPTIVPKANAAMGALLARAGELIDDYQRLPDDERPDGVDRMGGDLHSFQPVMRRMARAPNDLSGEELAVLVVGSMAGIVGNVQASVCIAVRSFFKVDPRNNGEADSLFESMRQLDRLALRRGSPAPAPTVTDPLWHWIAEALRRDPPVPFLPRRTCDMKPGAELPADAECVLAIGAATEPGRPFRNEPVPQQEDPLIFGLDGRGAHACIGHHIARPLVTTLVRHVLQLPGIAERLDPEDGAVIGLEKRWGFACVRYPMSYRRDLLRRQQSLNVSMRIKSPFKQHADALRAVIRIGAPRIERSLREAPHVHFAWFEFTDNDKRLVLHTVYDGAFDAYVEHFALTVGDLFDQLFEHLEDGPRTPVEKFPAEFVATIRRYNMAPASGYFYSAYPQSEAARISRIERGRP